MILALLPGWTSPRRTSGLLAAYWWNSVRRPSEGPMKPGDGEAGAHSTFSYDLVTAYLSLVPSTRETTRSLLFSSLNIAFS